MNHHSSNLWCRTLTDTDSCHLRIPWAGCRDQPGGWPFCDASQDWVSARTRKRLLFWPTGMTHRRQVASPHRMETFRAGMVASKIWRTVRNSDQVFFLLCELFTYSATRVLVIIAWSIGLKTHVGVTCDMLLGWFKSHVLQFENKQT